MGRKDVLDILSRVAAEEASFRDTRFVAPCVPGGRVRARIAGLVRTFAPRPPEFGGWGVFTPDGDATARLVEEADLPLVAAYLSAFPVLRLRLVRALSGQTWLAYPVSESDMAQRFGGAARPAPVHLVTEGAPFEIVTARGVGGSWWFEDVDRRADPMQADRLRDAFRALTEPADLRFPGLTPEMRTAYDLAAQQDDRFARRRQEQAQRAARQAAADARRQARTAANAFHRDGFPLTRGGNGPRNAGDEGRLRNALAVGGGALHDYSDRGEYWLVEWATGDGTRHTSAIAKADLTVVSSGVCLSGRDRDFDLQSLVRVIEQGTWGDW
jgi:hypothetical protein